MKTGWCTVNNTPIAATAGARYSKFLNAFPREMDVTDSVSTF
jgi:hypothetical protein